MSMAAGNIITVNAGSSSIKLAVFAASPLNAELTRLLDVSISDIGQPTSVLQVTTPITPLQGKTVVASNYMTAATILMDHLTRILPPESVISIGHRLVHGGGKYKAPTAITDMSADDWSLLLQLDPEHTLPARQLMTLCTQYYPSVSQTACFDTAFFQDLPRVAKVIPIPQKYYDLGVQRYGFHGLSYTSLLTTFREKAGDMAANGRVVLAHLGSGASLAATRFGKPIDTTMGFTPTSGIVMSTRSGDLDPSIFGFLHEHEDMSVRDFSHMVNFESGLLGVSQLTGDMHALLEMESENEHVALAIELFVRDVKKSIGALATTLGGLDSLLFSGGIGEQSAILRARICQDLEYMGIEIEQSANERSEFLISTEHGKVGIHVIPTDEALVIATQTREQLYKTNEREERHGINR
jgi:acetate kinase